MAVFMRSLRVCPEEVFSFLPLKTAILARLPRAILLTAFFFMTRAFIAVVAFIAFMAFMAFIAFIADFIGRAMLEQKQSIG
jgi:hypothetical protein